MAPHLETHVGTCHCQRIKFTVRIPPLADSPGAACDCSHCARRGLVWAMADAADFALERGRGELRTYAFGNKNFQHLSCATCGTHIAGAKSADTFPDAASGKIMFNVRALRDIDVHDVPRKPYSGAALPPAYVPATPFRPDVPLKDGHVVVPGACHCQAVQFAVRTLPLERDMGHGVVVKDCNCSICGGNGAVWVYPQAADLLLAPGAEAHLQEYAFAPPEKADRNRFYSCATCSCLVYEHRAGAPKLGVNVRLMDVDLAQVDVTFSKEASQREPQYEVK
ncbi:hypothetical protein Q5752_003083 [Cryptotrichosporon argae]